MKKLLFALALTPALCSFAQASDDPLECAKKDGELKCEVKKDKYVIDSVTINGGECVVPSDAKYLHHKLKEGEKFTVHAREAADSPLPDDPCIYVRMVTFKAHGGKKKTFNAL
jgi:hypothetical protein